MDSWLFCTLMKPVLNMDWIYTKKSSLVLIESDCIIYSTAVAAFYDILKKRLTLHSDISSYCLFLSHSIACDANIFSCIIPVTTGDVQLFGVWKLNPRFFPSYLRFRKTRGITAQKQRSWSVNCYILWHFCELDRNWKKGEEQKSFQTITLGCNLVHPIH